MKRAEYNAMRADQKRGRVALERAVITERKALRKQQREQREAAQAEAQRKAAQQRQETNERILASATDLVLTRVRQAGGALNFVALMARWPEAVPANLAERAIARLCASEALIENVQAGERVLVVPSPLTPAA